MSEKVYIKDDFGNQIPLLDDFGNLSMQVIMLYTEDKLTGEDRKAVDAFVATDEMSRDALEGYALTTNASKTRHQVNELNAEIQQRSGAKAVSPLMPKQESSFDYQKLAAAIALLVVVGGATFLLSQVWNKDELADNSEQKEKSKPAKVPVQAEPIYELTDSIMDENLEQDKTLVDEVVEPKEIETKANTKPFEEPNKAKLSEKKSDIVSTQFQTQADKAVAETIIEEAEAEVVEIEEDAAADYDNSKDLAGAVANDDMAAGNGMMEPTNVEAQEVALQQAEEEDQTKREAVARMAAEQQAKMPSRNEAAAVSTEAKRQDSDGRADQNQTAKYPGGDLKMYKFIERKKNYPNALKEQGVSGNVTVTFEINKDGRVINAKVRNGVNGVLDQDALRVVRSMPNWSPAMENGEPVKSLRSVVVKYGD